MNFNKQLAKMDKDQLLGMACNFIKTLDKMDITKNGDLLTKMQAVVSEITQRKDIDLDDDFIPVWKSAMGHPQTMSNVEIMKSLTGTINSISREVHQDQDLIKAAYDLSIFTRDLPKDTKSLAPKNNNEAMEAMLEVLGTTPKNELKEQGLNVVNKSKDDAFLDFIESNQELLKRL